MEQVFLLNKSDLKEVLLAILTEEGFEPKPKDEILSATELKDRLEISNSTLWRWEKCGLIQPRRMGRKKFFSLNEVKLAMKGGL